MSEQWHAYGFEDNNSRIVITRLPRNWLVNTFVRAGNKIASFSAPTGIGNSKNRENKFLAEMNEKLQNIHPEATIARDARHLSTMNVYIPSTSDNQVLLKLQEAMNASTGQYINSLKLAQQVAEAKKKEERARSEVGAEIRRGENRIEVQTGHQQKIGAPVTLAYLKQEAGVPLTSTEVEHVNNFVAGKPTQRTLVTSGMRNEANFSTFNHGQGLNGAVGIGSLALVGALAYVILSSKKK